MHTNSHQLDPVVGQQLEETIQSLATESIPEPQAGRRSESRHPFCRPLSIIRDGGETVLSGFSRDISSKGIGLLHSFPIEPGEVILQIPRVSGQPVRIRTEILWVHVMADSWYTSGGRFIEQLADESRPDDLAIR